MSPDSPDFDTVRRFLLWLYPTGPWTLTAISLNKKSIDSETFVDLDAVTSWIKERQRFNIYYSVNQPLSTSSNKTKFSKTDIESVHYLHVDVDPRIGEKLPSERERIHKMLTSYRIPQSAIIFSGGGYNALWKLDSPISLLASAPEDHIRNAIEVERRNWQFELDFATPDHCRDVSRILRLPGTVNWPNADKVEKYGRVPEMAKIVELNDFVYSYGVFMATPVAPVNITSSPTRVTQDVRRVESIDQLEVPERLKKIIVQGHDPDDPKAQKSRSEWLFYVCCELVRCGVPDEVIHGVISDSRFGISESVLDKGSGVARYALRQITRAKDLALHPRLLELNDNYAVICDYGGRCVVMEEKPDGTQSFRAPKEFFAERASKQIIWKNDKGKEVAINDGKWWFNQPRRREYKSIVFDPAGESPGSYNVFRGFAVQPVAGTKHEMYLQHLRDNVCSGRVEYYEYLVKWMARVVQTPNTQSEVAVVVIGKRGTGKSFPFKKFAEIFGPHGVSIDSMDHLTGRFNAHLLDKIVLVAEEAYHVYDRRHESSLKELITGQMRAFERKGYDVFWRQNYVHLILTSNNDRVVPAGDHERRFLVLKMSDNVIQNTAYFARLDEDMRNGGLANLLHYLMSLDLAGFDVRVVPRTEALVQQQLLSMPSELEWLLNKLQTGIWIKGDTKVAWEGPVVKEDLYNDYLLHVMKMNVQYPMAYRVWHEWLAKQIPLESKQMTPGRDGSRPWAFLFKPIELCRDHFLGCRSWPNYDWESPSSPVATAESDGGGQGEVF